MEAFVVVVVTAAVLAVGVVAVLLLRRMKSKMDPTTPSATDPGES